MQEVPEGKWDAIEITFSARCERRQLNGCGQWGDQRCEVVLARLPQVSWFVVASHIYVHVY